jgi:hypothetical protein
VPPPVAGDPNDIARKNAERAPAIDAQTAVADPYEPRPDYGLAVGALLDLMHA